MKKARSILLCLCLALSVFTVVPFAASAAEVTEESVGATSGTTVDCTWALDDNDTLTISGYGAMGDYSSQKLNGTWITTAPWGANIKTVIIEDGVTYIGSPSPWVGSAWGFTSPTYMPSCRRSNVCRPCILAVRWPR